ncbi:MAG: hypothetical protein H6585_02245 [Flavobacteriales bacterium]|nr:hypothetical protein [Flavobacteriales bacterium]MCB9447148.1 hypothetical protein [Flavobacteriales bacterium]
MGDYRSRLKGWYVHAAVYPSIAMVVVCTIYSVWNNRDYQSEWLTSMAVVRMMFLFALVYGVWMCLLALPMWLNKNERVRNNGLLNTITWWGCPLGNFMAWTLYVVRVIQMKNDSAWPVFIYALILNLPYILSLARTYVQQRAVAIGEMKQTGSLP